MSDQLVVWAEINRGGKAILIPSVAWEEALLPRIGDYESTWDKATESWRVAADGARLIAVALRELPISELTKGLAKRPTNGFWTDSIPVQALTESAAATLREEAVRFLDAGEFRWHFIQA